MSRGGAPRTRRQIATTRNATGTVEFASIRGLLAAAHQLIASLRSQSVNSSNPKHTSSHTCLSSERHPHVLGVGACMLLAFDLDRARYRGSLALHLFHL